MRKHVMRMTLLAALLLAVAAVPASFGAPVLAQDEATPAVVEDDGVGGDTGEGDTVAADTTLPSTGTGTTGASSDYSQLMVAGAGIAAAVAGGFVLRRRMLGERA